MKQKIFTTAIVFVVVSLLTIVIMGSRGKKTNTQATQLSAESSSSTAYSSSSQVPIFFYSNTCPHCKNVENWMKETKIEEKVKIVKKEVYNNFANSLELAKVAKGCGLLTDNIGVPFLYTSEGKCLIGTPDIVAYLSDKAGLSSNTEATSSEKEDEQ